MIDNNYELVNNEDRKQYELHIEGMVPRIEYILTKDNKIYLTHTEVPKVLEGKGIASAMVKQTLSAVEASGRKLVPMCPYVAQYLKKHPEWKRLLAEGINIE